MEKYSQKTAQKGAFFKIFKPIIWAKGCLLDEPCVKKEVKSRATSLFIRFHSKIK